ncbi:hypothetical protein PFISCL1PPCAC_7176, partial [Pristionchus fissidentatus]
LPLECCEGDALVLRARLARRRHLLFDLALEVGLLLHEHLLDLAQLPDGFFGGERLGLSLSALEDLAQ